MQLAGTVRGSGFDLPISTHVGYVERATLNTEPQLRGQVMKEFNAEETQFETASALESISQKRTIGSYPA